MKKLKKFLSILLWALKQISQSAKFSLIPLVLMILTLGLFPSLNLYLLKSLTDALGSADPFRIALPILICWVGLILLEHLFTPISQVLRIKVNERIYTHFNTLLIKKADSFNGLEIFENKNFQNEIEVLREQTRNKPLNLMYILTDSMKGLIAIASILFLLGSISIWLPFVIACSVLPQVIYSFTSEKKIWDHHLFHSDEARRMGRITSLFLEISTIKEIKIFNAGDYLKTVFKSFASSCYKRTTCMKNRQFFSSLPFTLCSVSGQAIALAWIAWSLKNQTVTLPTIIVMIQSLSFLHRESLVFIQDVNMLSSVISYFETFRKFMGRKDSLKPFSKPIQLQKHDINTIEFQNISFGYEQETNILHQLSFKIQRNEKVAVVGPNGSGKSTLIKLLCRFYDSEKGKILINGNDLKEIDIFSWREQISTIFQDYGKYPLSIKENVALSNYPELNNQEAILHSLDVNGLGYFRKKFPHSLETMLGKEFSGEELSHGEWQKMALARLYFRDASLIVMDEPTASLDPESEYEIFQNLVKAFKQNTVILVTHRLSSARACDRILLLKNGRLVEEGSHENLMKKQGDYCRLFSLQASGYGKSEREPEFSDYSLR